MTYHFLALLISCLITHSTSTTPAPNILDISDYTFHYTTYHYTLPSLSTETTTIYNSHFQSNITIHFSSTITIIINNTTINLLNDDQFHEISNIYSLNTHTHSPIKKRSLIAQSEPGEADEEQEQLPKIREGIRRGMPYTVANHYCRSTRRGHHVTIHSEEENSEIAGMCGTLGFARWHCWIGLMRPFGKWIDESQVDFTYWLPGEPSNWGGNENCVEIYSEQNEKYAGWNDLQCSMSRSFICEKEPIVEQEQELEKECDECMQEPTYRRALLNCNTCHKGKGKGRKTSEERERMRDRKDNQKKWWREKERQRKRIAEQDRQESSEERGRGKERRRRKRLREHLRELRRKQREGMMSDYQRERVLEKRRDSGYRLLDRLIGAALGYRHGLLGRRRMMGNSSSSSRSMEMMARCRVVKNTGGIWYEVCVNYNVGDAFLSVDIRFVDEMVVKKTDDRIDFRRYDMERMEEEDDEEMSDEIEDNLGYIVWKYELMDWHTFKSVEDGDRVRRYEYGEYKELADYIHYFDEYELYFNNNKGMGYDGIDEEYVECSTDNTYLPFRMCMKQVIVEDTKDTVLYFEGNGDMDDVWKDYIFYYNDDEIWDEMSIIHVGDDMQWMKKCSFRLLIAKICIEQFHVDDSRASIKFLSQQTYIPP